jgi:hypothetical protein
VEQHLRHSKDGKFLLYIYNVYNNYSALSINIVYIISAILYSQSETTMGTRQITSNGEVTCVAVEVVAVVGNDRVNTKNRM